MTSPISDSERSRKSVGFSLLHPSMQRWVYEQGWTSLHDAQELAVAPIVQDSKDVIISAATAAGKTEAAFLPMLSALATARDAGDTRSTGGAWTAHDPWNQPGPVAAQGVEILYLAPLKALINDQFARLEMMCAQAQIEVHRWHGDVSGAAKARTRRNPSGVLLITPESLEAMFVNRGTEIQRMFAGLRFVVVDELHSFLSTPRGAQLQSLLNRLELAIRRKPSRIGLSATLGDMSSATAFLRPSAPSSVLVIESKSDGQDLQLQLRGYQHSEPRGHGAEPSTIDADDSGDDIASITQHLFHTLRGTDNLVFANSRRDVELFADRLARLSADARIPNEFWPHHGSLSRDARETVEAQLKDRAQPATAVCTSTLEMGIDIGSVTSIAQIGPPPSVAAMRQRLGRSGRRDTPSVLRLYVREQELDQRSGPADQLRCNLVQSIAMVRLLLDRWIEAPDDPGWHLSTLIQQILSVIAQHGGAKPSELHRALCGPGPFHLVDEQRFAQLLRSMAAKELIVQADDGTLLHGSVGERIANHYSFYTAFETPQEWRLLTDGRPLGSLPITGPLETGGMLIFGGRRWSIRTIDSENHVLDLTPSPGGVPPKFGGNAPPVGDRVRREMVSVFNDSVVPPWLDANARDLLLEARENWLRLGLRDRVTVSSETSTIVLPWTGDAALRTATLMLTAAGVEAVVDGPSIVALDTSPSVLSVIASSLIATPIDAPELARGLDNLWIDKWDWALDDDLAAESAAARLLDPVGALRILEMIS